LRVRVLSLPALLLVCSSLPGCTLSDQEREGESFPPTGQTPSEGVIHLVDAAGQELTFQTAPERILSLIPSASEILYALGAGSQLVGRTDFDTTALLAHLPSVGGGLHPNLEAVVGLAPDLVIRFAGGSDQATPLRLDELGIPHLALRPDGVEDIRTSIGLLGTVAQRGQQADSLLAQIDTTLSEIRRRVEGRDPVRVAYLLGGSPPWVAGPGSYIEELLELAGGINVFSDLSGLYGPVNVEVFLIREMDLILAPVGGELGIPETDVPIRRVNGSLEIPGPSLAHNAWELARILHPEAFR
jgi:iron complex transport system substrate-binding protein